MQPMGNEKPGPQNFPGSTIPPPFAPSPTHTVPYLPSSGPMVRSEYSGNRATTPGRFDGPYAPPSQPPYVSPNAGPYHPFATAPIPQPSHSFRPFSGPHAAQAVMTPPTVPSGGQQVFQHPPVPFHPQPQIPSMPMVSPPQPQPELQKNGYHLAQRGNAPSFPSDSSYPAARPSPYGYPYGKPNPVNQGPPAVQSSTFPGGYAPTFPLGAHMNLNSRDPVQHPGGGPPLVGFPNLVEEFSSLSVGSAPGSLDPGFDPKSLPRPLDGDIEPSSLSAMYPSNCASRYLRLTTSAIPNSQSMLSRWNLPLAAVIHPLAEAPDGEEVPVVNFGHCGIIRCRRCRTYVNPYVTFTDAGRKWRCNMCTFLNDVPGEYFAHLDASGRRIDADQRPELTKGSVDLVAPLEYMVRPPMPPLFFFLIDVSISAVQSGMLEVVSETIKSCLDELPGSSRTQIGFLTFDSTLHFYNMKSSLKQPQMMVVSDLDDIFVPLPDDLLVNLSESRGVVESFLDSLPSMFQDNVNMESAFGPALKAAFSVMSKLGGKLMIFQSTLPTLGDGRLRLRDDLRAYGTDKEHALRIPEDPFYKQMAADLTKFQIGVNLYAFSDKYTDLASLGTLAKYTGGQVYYYPSFQKGIHEKKLSYELARDLTRETAWEAVMRIRCGKGVRFTTYHGHFMLRSTDLLALPAVDCDKAFSMQLSLEETLLTTQTVYFQVALLYTSSSGERRIRVHTAAAPVVADLGEMYLKADAGAIVSQLSRLAIEKSLSCKLEDARQFVQLRIVKALKDYRNLYSVQNRVGGRMIYPESLKLLPLYGLALIKTAPLRGGFGDVPIDERTAASYTMMTMPTTRLIKLLYPRLVRIDEYLEKESANADDFKTHLRNLPLTSESLDFRGIYLYDNGLRFIIWFGRTISSNIANKLVGVDLNSISDLSKVNLCEHDNDVSRKLMKIVNKFRERDPSCYQHCHLVKQGEHPREGLLLLLNLVEDQIAGSSGYVDWILQIHRQVQQSP